MSRADLKRKKHKENSMKKPKYKNVRIEKLTRNCPKKRNKRLKKSKLLESEIVRMEMYSKNKKNHNSIVYL